MPGQRPSADKPPADAAEQEGDAGASPEKVEMDFESIASENFSRWNEALLTGDPEQVAALYTEDATFLPTVSGDFKLGQDGAEQYFEHFLESNPSGEVIDAKVQPLGPDSYLHSGMYNFEVDSADPESAGKRIIVEARFTFAWGKNADGEWRIMHHHSSVRPKS